MVIEADSTPTFVDSEGYQDGIKAVFEVSTTLSKIMVNG